MALPRSVASRTALISLALLVGLSGCATSVPTPAAPALVDDFQVDLEVEIALTILDEEYSLAELSALKTSSLKIFEPFDQADTEFTVIDFGQLLLDSGFSESDEIVTVALNDYRYTDTVAKFIETGAKLAILENGEPIPVSEGGPVRIVFNESSSYSGFLDAWNWSVRFITRAGE